ncbi:hypothetical protein Scep_026138 [Stephania cephalantha]|uniref:Uncharacterized protein n=1 Tax=Stephania cephalantha TaxID=152367 RepID=A0AAP0EK00_9MAGN
MSKLNKDLRRIMHNTPKKRRKKNSLFQQTSSKLWLEVVALLPAGQNVQLPQLKNLHYTIHPSKEADFI